MGFNRNHTHAAKLTPSQVMEIRRLYATEGWTQGRLSRQFQVTIGQIGRIVRGESWQQYAQIAHDQELEFMAAEPPAPSIDPMRDPEFLAMMERMKSEELLTGVGLTGAMMPVSAEIAERAAAYGAAPIHRKVGLSSEMNAALDDLEAARAQLSKPAIQAQAADATVDKDVPPDPPGTGLAGYSSPATERGLVGHSHPEAVIAQVLAVTRAMHSVTCPNIDILDPQGAFKNAAGCPCQHENPLGGSK